jgi:CheY-like chemotaxis protein
MGEGGRAQVIMVVDDQDGNREILRLFLTETGYIVKEASNGLVAVNLATRECPDLIIMDLAMPVMDGFNAVGILRRTSATRDVPIVAFTAYDTPEHRALALSTGFNEFLTKPVDFMTLQLVLSRFLKRI